MAVLPVLVAISGFKDTGKTWLCEQLAGEMQKEGLQVGFLKHCHDPVRGSENNDTGRLALQGLPVALLGNDGVRFERDANMPLDTLAALLFPEADLVLVEGAKGVPLPRIWVGAPESLPSDVRGVFAVYHRGGAAQPGRVYVEGEEVVLAHVVRDYVMKNTPSMEIYIGRKRLPMKAFIADFVRGSLEGMLRALKGGEDLAGGLFALIPAESEKSKNSREEKWRL